VWRQGEVFQNTSPEGKEGAGRSERRRHRWGWVRLRWVEEGDGADNGAMPLLWLCCGSTLALEATQSYRATALEPPAVPAAVAAQRLSSSSSCHTVSPPVP
jgi:hypothetical protein